MSSSCAAQCCHRDERSPSQWERSAGRSKCRLNDLNEKVLAPLHANAWLRPEGFSSPLPCDALVIRLLFEFQERCSSAESLCETLVHIHRAAVQGERASVGDEQEVAQSSRRRCGDNRRTDEQQVRSGCSDSQDKSRCSKSISSAFQSSSTPHTLPFMPSTRPQFSFSIASTFGKFIISLTAC